MKNLIFLLLVLPMLSMAQVVSPLQKGVSLSQGIAKAKEANKFLLAVYFESPEQEDNSRIFNNERAVRFINKNFVGVKFMKGLETDTYPTYLVFSPDGTLVHRVASERYAYNFIDKISKSLDPATQYYTMIQKFEGGDRSADLLKNLTRASVNANEPANVSKFLEAYLATATDQFATENLKFWMAHTSSSAERGFELLRKYASKADAILGEGKAAEKVAEIIFNEEFVPSLGEKRADAAQLAAAVKAKYPEVLPAQRIDLMVVEFYELQENWKMLEKVLPVYMEQYASELSPETLNYYAFVVQEFMGNRPELVQNALSWSKRSLKVSGKDLYKATYTKLLDKSGVVKEASLLR